MADQARVTSQLPIYTGSSANDRVIFLGNTAGRANTATITWQNLLSNTYGIPVNLISPPANSSALVITGGSAYTDGTYLYVATANNTLKRVMLSSF